MILISTFLVLVIVCIIINIIIVVVLLFIQHPSQGIRTRTQDLFSHLYVCGRWDAQRGYSTVGGEWLFGDEGARGYVNFSVKIHFVIMDFPCRIHRSLCCCHRRSRSRSRRRCQLPPSAPSPIMYPQKHSSPQLQVARQRQLPPARMLGHDRW